MELSQDMIIDLTLNIIGYVLAGCLSILLFTVFSKEKRVEKKTQKQSLPAVEPALEPTPIAVAPVREVVRQAIQDVKTDFDLNSNSQFLRFGKSGNDRKTPATVANSTSSTSRGYAKRDRAHIIRVATEMLKAGASADKIKGVIPVTDAELALLNFAKLN